MPKLKHKDLLLRILERPTAPFRERHVISEISAILREHGVPFFSDPIGNLVIGVRNQAEYRTLVAAKSPDPVRVFIAHMDHPGFHGAEWKNGAPEARAESAFLSVQWHGGTPTQHLEGKKVWLADAGGWLGEGTLVEAKMMAHGRAIESGVLRVDRLDRPQKKATAIYGAFSFRAPVWEEGELLYTKAADDLVGAFAIVSTAIELLGKKPGARKSPGKKPARKPAKNPGFIGLLTRAEEVGFIGAIAHFELGWLGTARKKTGRAARGRKDGREVVAVSLETSRTLPGADIGKGPIVRLGDRRTVFNSGGTNLLAELAKKELPEKFQRRIMDGGACEGTAANAYGLRTIAMSVPLGNYHNQSLEGGPDAGPSNAPAPEFVHLDDVAGLVTMCGALMRPKLAWAEPFADLRAEFRKSLKKYAALLKSAP